MEETYLHAKAQLRSMLPVPAAAEVVSVAANAASFFKSESPIDYTPRVRRKFRCVVHVLRHIRLTHTLINGHYDNRNIPLPWSFTQIRSCEFNTVHFGYELEF